MNNVLLRSLTGIVFITLIIGALWFGFESSVIVMGIFLALGLVEFFQLFKESKAISISTKLSTIVHLCIFGICILSAKEVLPDGNSIVLISPILFLLFLTELWRKKENPLLNIGIMGFGFFYLVIPFYLIILLNIKSNHENPLAIGMFLLIWTNDVFAYLMGRLVGRTKLFERISPKKTIEGTIGGILFTILVGYLISLYTLHYSTIFWIISALIIAPCAIFGDLLESLFKRSLNIKDSGTILPGHGGILDRFDATLFAVPFFYCWLMIYSYF